MSERRLHLRCVTSAETRGPTEAVRSITPADVGQIAELMVSAYRGTVDYEGETVAEAAEEIRRTVDGAYGEFLPVASFGYWRNSILQAAVIVTRFEGRPLFAFCMTRAENKRQGLCRTLMSRSLGALHAIGEAEAHLFVTATNTPAVRLYRTLGFESEPDGRTSP